MTDKHTLPPSTGGGQQLHQVDGAPIRAGETVRCLLVRMARQRTGLLHDCEAEVQDMGQKPSGPLHRPVHLSDDIVKVQVNKTGPKMRVTTSHGKHVQQTVLLQAIPKLIALIKVWAILGMNWSFNPIVTYKEMQLEPRGSLSST